jgi:hypothetical protein
LFESRTVTVIVVVVTPFASTVVGEAVTIDVAPEGGPINVTTAIFTTLMLPFTVALIVAEPATPDLTVPAICPLAFVVPEG